MSQISGSTTGGGGGGGITTINGSTGSTNGPVVTITATTASAGQTLRTPIVGTTQTITVSDASNNTVYGAASGAALAGGSTQNTIIGANAGTAMSTGQQNTVVGYNCGNNLTSAFGVVYLGYNAGQGSNGTIGGTTALGNSCFKNIPAGTTQNVAVGANAMSMPAGSTTMGFGNVAIGYGALDMTGGFEADGVGNFNICLGDSSGQNIGAASTSNIYIHNQGAAESNTMRIGNGTGNGGQQLNQTFISGIRGITTGNVDALPVLIDSAGQLGTVSSSIRFKDNVRDMAPTNVLALRPVNFTYKSDKTGKTQYGLIAEEVEQVFPDLVAYDQEGQPESVKYQDLAILLLKEIQKLKADVEELKARV